jgi:hypothetical protein
MSLRTFQLNDCNRLFVRQLGMVLRGPNLLKEDVAIMDAKTSD